MAVQLMTKSAYARHRGCDEKAVRKAIAEQRISAIDGRIDPEVADIQWARNTRARADSRRASVPGTGDAALAGQPPDAGGAPAEPGYSDYRAIREKAEAEMAQRANMKDAGTLLGRQGVERGIYDVVRAFRDSVMAIGQRAAPACIGLADARDIEHAITEETRKALDAFEARLLALLPPKESA